MSNLIANQIIECEGLACPLPVVRTKKAMDGLAHGDVLEVRATDRGSVADLQNWSKKSGHQYVGLKEENGVYRHFIRKVSAVEAKEQAQFPEVISTEEVQAKLASGERLNLIDVREPAEFAFGRVPGARSIPLGELEGRLEELDPAQSYIIFCRSGNRSDMACQLLLEKGFKHVKNAVPGMNGWTGEVEQD